MAGHGRPARRLGDWRPEKSGLYGRFDVQEVTELPDAA